MLDQLGVTNVRPGRDSNPKSANPANYDQAKANPYPKLPEILETKDGKKVTTPDQWWNKRRPEILKFYRDEIYGHIPANAPKVTWEVAETDPKARDGAAVMRRTSSRLSGFWGSSLVKVE